jgi:hypothetical protein
VLGKNDKGRVIYDNYFEGEKARIDPLEKRINT